MFGILTDDRVLARAGVGDFTHFFAESVDGSRRDPLATEDVPGDADAITTVACWGDTATVREDSDRAAVAADGTRASPDAGGHHWGTVCPTDPDYRAALLDRIGDVGAAGDVRLTTLGFPGESFCHCERCDREFAASEYVDEHEYDEDARDAWRTSVITEFTAAAAERVAGDLLVTLYPDPYPGHLRERAGLDPDVLDAHVDGFVVPLCRPGYATTYWVEPLAHGFADVLAALDATLTIQLSAADVEVDRLADVTRRVLSHADATVYGTHPGDEDVVRETIRRVREDAPRTTEPRRHNYHAGHS